MKIEATLEDMLQSSDWEEAFHYAAFRMSEVETVLASVNGMNDSDSWVTIVRLKDGRYGYLTAWCDYTGWGCQEGGHSDTRAVLEDVVRELCGEDDRKRFGIKLPEDTNR